MELVEQEVPDLILLDFGLPGMEGLETLEHLRANLHTTYTAIIAIPGMSRMISDCEAYVRKPFDLVLLRRVVTQSLAFHPARHHYR